MLARFLFLYLDVLGSSVLALPFYDHVSLNIRKSLPTKVWEPVKARAMPAAIAAASAGVANTAQQVQNVTSTAGGNSSSPEPGVITNSQYESPTVDCMDLTSGRDNKCWEDLGLTQFVHNWTQKNLCRRNEAWASCFLRLESFTQLDCTGLKLAACTPPPITQGLDPRVFYVAYNIYGINTLYSSCDIANDAAINQFFLSWYTAVGDSASIAGENVDAIVQLLDPVDDTHLILDNVLIALTGIFAVAPGLGLGAATITGAVEGVSNSIVVAAQTVENALVAFPQIGRYLFPVETAASQIVQMSALKSQLVGLVSNVQGNLNKTLVEVMNNQTGFLAFASQGNFTENAPSLPDQENYLLYAFNTYVISAGLAGNNVYGVMAKGTNVKDLVTNGTRHLAYDLSACQQYNEENVCDAFWYSETYQSTFGLDNFNKMNRNYGDVLTKLFKNYTTGQLLFDNAYACNSNGNYGQPVNVTVNAAGVNTQCLSQLQIVTWDMFCNDPHNLHCEFLELPRQNTFFQSCSPKTDLFDDHTLCVPYAYLGPLVTDAKYRLVRT